MNYMKKTKIKTNKNETTTRDFLNGEKKFDNRGAEAKIYFSQLFGKPVVIKKREVKNYRNRILDEYLREIRNKTEARCILTCSKNKIPVPQIYHVERFEIIMERLNGKLLKETKNSKETYKKVGAILAEMHKAGITHGDFTPANIMKTKNGIYVIDFGLAMFSKDSEERAIDLLLMKRSVGKNFKYIIEGYRKLPNWEKVLETMQEIEKRGRYHKRDKDKKNEDN